ncbi:MAG: L-threonylcarbamoyladenylate synthase [Cytophagales bacterium]
MLLSIHPDNPQIRLINQAVKVFRSGGVVIYPTDTVYGIGCDFSNPKAVERIYKIKGEKINKAQLAFICKDLAQAQQYIRNISTPTFRLLKKSLPGPYTFLLEANNSVPKIMGHSKKQVGLRIPNHPIPLAIVEELGNPIVTSSLKHDDEVLEYYSDPDEIYDRFKNEVDLVIDGGILGKLPSTVISCLNDDFEVIREGAGSVDVLN